MVQLKYTPRNFLRFHVKKGVEFSFNGDIIAIRSKTFDNVMETNMSLLVTAEGKEGFMLFTPEDMRKEIDSISPKIKGKDYHLLFYKWLPVSADKLELLDMLYTYKIDFDKRINKLLND